MGERRHDPCARHEQRFHGIHEWSCVHQSQRSVRRHHESGSDGLDRVRESLATPRIVVGSRAQAQLRHWGGSPGRRWRVAG